MANNPEDSKLASSERPSFEHLGSSYPLIFRAYLHPELYPMYPIAERRFECGLGWYGIIDELSAWLESRAQEFLRQGCEKIPVVAQCKEKFGSLRYYVFEIPEDQEFRDELTSRLDAAYERSCCTSELEGEIDHGPQR